MSTVKIADPFAGAASLIDVVRRLPPRGRGAGMRALMAARLIEASIAKREQAGVSDLTAAPDGFTFEEVIEYGPAALDIVAGIAKEIQP